MVLRKFSEITNNKLIFSQYNFFYKYKYCFFQSAFWSHFNHRQKSQSNQEHCSLCCSSPCFHVSLCTHYGPLQCFSTYFRKLKEIGVLRPIFRDYVISCDYDADLKISRYACVHIKTMPWKSRFLNSKNFRVICPRKIVNFLKSRLTFNIFYCFWIFVNKLFTYFTCAYLKT